MKVLLTWKTKRALVTTGTIVTVGAAVTKVASGYHTQSPRTVAARTTAASTGSDSTDSLGEESLAIDHTVRVDSTLARVQDRAAERGQHSKAVEHTRRIGVRRESGRRIIAF
jgi:hypothetical protein